MKAIMPTLLPDVAAMRKRNGSDRWDEIWEGVLHMPPAPNRDHQRFQFKLLEYLEYSWAQPTGSVVYHDRNVTASDDWLTDYRVPDLSLLTTGRMARDKNEYIAGGPDVVIEIHSPGDEAYQKLDFYARIGVREAWIIDRDSKEPEIYRLEGTQLNLQPPSSDGWHVSEVTGLEMHTDGQGKLRIRWGNEPATEKSLPE